MKGADFFRGKMGLKKSLTFNDPQINIESSIKVEDSKNIQIKNRIRKSMELI